MPKVDAPTRGSPSDSKMRNDVHEVRSPVVEADNLIKVRSLQPQEVLAMCLEVEEPRPQRSRGREPKTPRPELPRPPQMLVFII